MKEMILDIGCGQGGKYLNELQDATVIGFDISEESLRRLRKTYPTVKACVGNATDNLPFQDHTIDRVNIVLPYAGLLNALLDSKRYVLWRNLDRVIRPGGYVSIVTEEYGEKQRDITNDNRWIEKPVQRIMDSAQDVNFLVDRERVDRQFVSNLGTYHSQYIANDHMKKSSWFKPVTCSLIIAIKP